MGAVPPRTEASSARPYRGVRGAERLAARHRRFLAAGLDLLGAEQQDISGLTVRGICRAAGLAVRYYYESFADKDEFVSAVFDSVVTELAASTQAAAGSLPWRERTRAAMANIVRAIDGDARVGRLLFSTQLGNSVIMRKRAESTALFAMLSGESVGDALQLPANDHIKAAAHFVVGGVSQTISAWLAGDVKLGPDELVDQLASLLDDLADPKLAGPRITETAAAAADSSPDPAATDASS
jgi:AcrR family transcriptional regulator